MSFVADDSIFIHNSIKIFDSLYFKKLVASFEQFSPPIFFSHESELFVGNYSFLKFIFIYKGEFEKINSQVMNKLNIFYFILSDPTEQKNKNKKNICYIDTTMDLNEVKNLISNIFEVKVSGVVDKFKLAVVNDSQSFDSDVLAMVNQFVAKTYYSTQVSELQRQLNLLQKEMKSFWTHLKLSSNLTQNQYRELFLSPEKHILVTVSVDPLIFLFIRLNSDIDSTTLKAISLIESSLIHSFDKISKIEQESEKAALWENIFKILPYPVAFFDSVGKLVLHNPAYGKLNVLNSICLSLEDQHLFEMNNCIYKINKKTINWQGQDCLLFAFIKGNTGNFKGNTQFLPEDLSIVSNSLAHELNNPLAGILAALSLLLIEDGLSEEEQKIIGEMKYSAIRCKDLVSTFLNFPRITDMGKLSPNIEESLNKAIGLTRFRMMETGIELRIHYSTNGQGNLPILNYSIFTIIFYLIFNELITFSSRNVLLRSDSSKLVELNQLVEGSIIESENGIKFSINNFDLRNKEQLIIHLHKNKLIKGLVELQNMSSQIHPDGFELRTT